VSVISASHKLQFFQFTKKNNEHLLLQETKLPQTNCVAAATRKCCTINYIYTSLKSI